MLRKVFFYIELLLSRWTTVDTRRFWHDRRLIRLSVATIAALAGAVAIVFVADHEHRSLLGRGDFPGFYGPAEILSRNLESRLYDPQLQRQVENELWPSFGGQFYYSVYPPYFYRLLQPLTSCTPQQAQWIFTTLMLLFFLLSLRYLRPLVPLLQTTPLPTAVYLFTLAPVFVAIVGAQNTALSLLLYCGAIALLNRRTAAGEWGAGVLLGLWLFKPQFGAFALFLALVGGRFRVVAGGAVVAFFYYLLGATVFGLSWPLTWFHALKAFAGENLYVNQQQLTSAIGFFSALGHLVDFIPAAEGILKGIGYLVTALVFLLTVSRFSVLWRLRTEEKRREYFPRLLLLLGPMLTVVSPQTLFYDLTLALIPCARYLSLTNDRTVTDLILFSLFLSLITFTREMLPVPPCALIAGALFLFVYWNLLRERLSR